VSETASADSRASPPRQVVLDTETTGLEIADGHRMIEIGCVELRDRRLTGRTFHHYLQPDRAIDHGAFEVHGISSEMLEGKPRFAQIMDELHEWLAGAELIIHNAPFDVGYIEHEFGLAERPLSLSDISLVTDSLALARRQFPGQRNNLDALCKRLGVNNSRRELHGALLDAEILADVYLAMTGGQTALGLEMQGEGGGEDALARMNLDLSALRFVSADGAGLAGHAEWMERLDKASEGNAWRRHGE